LFCLLLNSLASVLSTTSLFMGDLPSRDRVSVESRLIDSSLPKFDADILSEDHFDRDVYRLLAEGRKTETVFDVKQSPLAAYLYAYLGDDGLARVLREVSTPLYPMDEGTARNLLSQLPRPPVEVVADNIAKIARSRSDCILRVVACLPPADLKVLEKPL